MKAGGISVHAVDVAEGAIARGLAVVVRRIEPDLAILATGKIGDNGLLDHPGARGEGITAGTYEVEFDIATFLRESGRQAQFLDVVRFRFIILDAAQHYHLPFKFTPFGYSLFRGA